MRGFVARENLLMGEVMADAEKLEQLAGDGRSAGARGESEQMTLRSKVGKKVRELGIESDLVPAGREDLTGRGAAQWRGQLIAPQQRRTVPEGEIEVEDNEAGHGAAVA